MSMPLIGTEYVITGPSMEAAEKALRRAEQAHGVVLSPIEWRYTERDLDFRREVMWEATARVIGYQAEQRKSFEWPLEAGLP